MMFIIPALISGAALQQLQRQLASSHFVDGSFSAGPAASYQKNNLQNDPQDQQLVAAAEKVKQLLEQNPKFRTMAIPRRVRSVVFNLYREGMCYRDHIDHSLLPGRPPLRGDLSMTLFLSDPASYAGGELVVNSDGPHQVSVKLPAGHAVVYDANTMHRVNTVTSGQRFAAITTVESMINSSAQREIIAEMAQLMVWVEDNAARSEHERRAYKIYANLLRMWSQI